MLELGGVLEEKGIYEIKFYEINRIKINKIKSWKNHQSSTFSIFAPSEFFLDALIKY